MKKSSPIRAAGWISTPVTARVRYEIAIGAIGTSACSSACAIRWASRACTPAQLERISTVPALRAAGSRSRAVATSEATSRTTLPNVRRPSIAA